MPEVPLFLVEVPGPQKYIPYTHILALRSNGETEKGSEVLGLGIQRLFFFSLK